MKKIITLFYLALFAITMNAQAPQKMSYQAVIRNASNGLVANANIGMRISVLQGTATGTAVYVETQTATTNVNGLATVEIGAGTVVSGTFASIAWGSNAYFIKTETDPTGGSNYTIVGTSQFLSVPYALFASNSGSSLNNWTITGANIANNNAGNVGIGTGSTAPSSLLTVKTDGIGFTQESASGLNQIGFFTNAGNAWVQTHSDTDLSFATNNGLSQMTLQKGTGNLGINTINPTEKLEVVGKTKTTTLQVTTGAGAGKVLTSDAAGNATWATPATGVVNNYYEKSTGGLSTSTQGSQVDFPETNLTVPVAGTYLINYYVDATNNFNLACYNNCTNPRPIMTRSHLYNKTTNEDYQIMRLDHSDVDNVDPEGTPVLAFFTLPSHPVTASVIKTLSAGDSIGIKLESLVTAPGVSASITLSISSITAVRLF